jgi:hypothetical protein
MSPIHRDGVLKRMQLTKAQKKLLAEPPHWDLDPPQREEYADDETYQKGLVAYLGRVQAKKRQRGA